MKKEKKEKKLPYNTFRKGIVAGLLGLTMGVSALGLTGCSLGGEDGKNGTQWLTGTNAPEVGQGVDGDFYLNTSDYKLYQKENGQWVLKVEDFGKPGAKGDKGDTGEAGQDGQDGQDGQAGQNGQDGEDGQNGKNGDTPYIQDGNWWIGGVDTGIKAIGVDGKTPSISINSDGYWVINDQLTEYKAQCSADTLYAQLGDLMELSTESAFTMTYHPYALTDSITMSREDSSWSYTTSTFSGWGGSIGRPTNFNSISFKVRARGESINHITLYLKENDKSGASLAFETIDVNIAPYEEKTVCWNIPKTIENKTSTSLWFAYACDNVCDYNGTSISGGSEVENLIPEGEPQVLVGYFQSGGMELSGFNFVSSSTSVAKYLHVRVGNSVPKFVFKKGILEDLLKDSNIYNYSDTELCLANTINGFVGQEIQIYLENIIPYSLDDVYVRVSSNGKGKLYSDRWEYTPTSAENFELKISVYSKDFDLLKESRHTVNIKDTSSKSSAKVLVIGDSTVNAGKETAKMLDLAKSDSDFDLTLLGTRGSESNLYEGRGGWTASMYVNTKDNGTYTNPFYNTETSKFDFSYYMTQQSYDSVDVVFLQLGINDIFSATTETALSSAITTYINNLDYMVKSIKAYNADIKVVINPIIPSQLEQDKFTIAYGTQQTAWGYKYNMYKANMALIEKFGSDSNVNLSWYNASIDAYNNQSNDVHPADAGYNQLGEQMYYYLKNII